MAENPTLPGVSANTPGREFHPVSDLFPLLRGTAFQDLVADIRKNGLHEPILVDGEGRILDGRNRYRACLAAPVEPRFVQWQSEGSPAELALSRNLYRRHLNESQRAMVAARLAKWMEREAVERKSRHVANLQQADVGRSADKAAALINVSPRLIGYAVKVLRDGSDELIAGVESDGLAVSTASVLAGLPKPEQAEVLAGGLRAAAGRARELRGSKNHASRAPLSRGCFGVLARKAPEAPVSAGADDVALLWVPLGALADAVEVLKAGGFQYAPSGG